MIYLFEPFLFFTQVSMISRYLRGPDNWCWNIGQNTNLT